MAEPPSSPPTGDTSAEEALAWYKSQYDHLEQELAEFRESSKELEAELEKDLDAADKRERALREKAEGLEYEVEEWKVCLPPAKGPSCITLHTLSVTDNPCRGSTENPSPRRAQRKTPSKRRSRRSERRLGRCSFGCAT